jgi:hypothetical protein
MGLLDDAIREHLELKRQHGADPDEVSRQEREALGAARRAEFAKTAEVEAKEPSSEPVAEASEPVAAGDEREPFDVEAAEPAVPEPEPELEPDAIEPPPDVEAVPPGQDEDPWLEEERDEVPAGESLDHPRAPEPEPAAAVDPETGEDVLEETPEFLQETPEHDRLWFEQRPPRDFDWDK